MNKEIQTYDEKLQRAIAVIKEAILQGQYEACKGVNRIQLAVYFGIGKYISQHTRKGVWGTGALDIISDQLRRELPGLRGYSATQMKDMRLFYEAWSMLDANSSVATDELEKSTFAIAEIDSDNSPVATDEFTSRWKSNRYTSSHTNPQYCRVSCRGFFQGALYSSYSYRIWCKNA